MHSRRSIDSINSARMLINAARRRGLAGIAVTDHDTIAGGLDVAAAAPPDLLVVVGAEYYTDIGDIVGLFLVREVHSRAAVDVIDEIHDQGGLAVLPHPMRGHPAIPDAVLEAFDAYEALNSRAGWFDPRAAPDSQKGWGALTGKPVLASSDAHLPWEVGNAFTSIGGPITAENLRSSIVAGRTAVHGSAGPPRNFYVSQLVKAARSGDAALLVHGARAIGRRLINS